MIYQVTRNIRNDINNSLIQLQVYIKSLKEEIVVDGKILDENKLSLLSELLSDMLLFLDNSILPSVDDKEIVLFENDKSDNFSKSSSVSNSNCKTDTSMNTPKLPKKNIQNNGERNVIF